ncbi:MAG: type II secretion system protein [Planctomycetales bacterium]
MISRKTHTKRRHARHSAFSLIEIMVVLVIVSILMALLLPALSGVRTTAQIALVNAEMDSLKASITNFKREYGIEPPSGITLFPPGGTGALGNWTDARSVSLIRQMWPKFDFQQSGGLSAVAFGTATSLTLEGSECLVFFLGGTRDAASGALIGFSKNERLPFQGSGSRVNPFFEFDGGYDSSTSSWTGLLTDAVGNNGIPEYLGVLPSATKPYAYFSSYGGKGYRLAENDSIDGTVTATVANPELARPLPYFKDSASNVPYNRESFQLISTGFDYRFGVGGYFDRDDSQIQGTLITRNKLNDPSSTDGLHEHDNITNFNGGQLLQ